MVLLAALLNTHHYKIRIKGKWINPGKGVMPSATPQGSSYWKRSLWAVSDNGRPNYLYIYIYIFISGLQKFSLVWFGFMAYQPS